MSEGFDDERTGHDGELREVPEELNLVPGDVLQSEDSLPRYQLEHRIDQALARIRYLHPGEDVSRAERLLRAALRKGDASDYWRIDLTDT